MVKLKRRGGGHDDGQNVHSMTKFMREMLSLEILLIWVWGGGIGGGREGRGSQRGDGGQGRGGGAVIEDRRERC